MLATELRIFLPYLTAIRRCGSCVHRISKMRQLMWTECYSERLLHFPAIDSEQIQPVDSLSSMDGSRMQIEVAVSLFRLKTHRLDYTV
jgi:hypothetical protein